MAVDFLFAPATISLPVKQALSAFGWEHILDQEVADAIAEEEQYLRFHLEILGKLHFTEKGRASNPPWLKRVGLTARAGLIRSSVLLYASIAEAVLLYHARARGYELPRNRKQWSFGAAMRVWEDSPGCGKPQADIRCVWATIDGLRKLRNHVHLFNKAHDHRGRFGWLLEHEEDLVRAGQSLIEYLRGLESPYQRED